MPSNSANNSTLQKDLAFGPELWGIVGAYLFVLILILLYVLWIEKKNQKAYVERHFLASREMGPLVLGFSLCASMFSGYTVVGIPAEAWKDGFSAWRWVGSCTFISLVYLSYAPRLNYLAKIFKYDSLLSFVKDRYQLDPLKKDLNSLLYWLIVVVIFVPCFVYLAAQFIALANTLHVLSNGVLDKTLIGFLFAVMLFAYETLGGLRAVSATDVLQGSFLVFGAMSILGFIGPMYGGIEGVVNKLLQNPQSEKHVVGALANTDGFALNWAQFWIGVGLQRALFPDYMQRALSAKSQKTLKYGNSILLMAPFLIQVPLCFYGLIGQTEFPDYDVKKRNGIFAEVVKQIVNYSGVGAFFGSIMMAAAIAAIMSTADSVLIAVSHLVTLDVFRAVLLGGDSPKEDELGSTSESREKNEQKLKWVARIVTSILCLACIPCAAVGANLSGMIQFQATFLAQLFPLFVLGLYSAKVTNLAIGIGLLVGLSIGIPLISMEVNGAILISVVCNVLLVVGISFAQSFGAVVEGTPPQHLKKFIQFKLDSEKEQLKREPIHSPCFWIACIIPWFAIPFYRSTLKTGESEGLVSGTPAWAFTALMVLFATHLLMLFMCWHYWQYDESNDKLESGQSQNAFSA